MMNITIDFSDISRMFGSLASDIEKAANQAAAELAPAIYGHLLEQANSKLHSRRKMFVDALSFKQESDKSFVVTLDKKAVWIDDGMDEHSMLEALLKSPKAKHAADGSTYIVVPFDHSPGKGVTNSTPAQQSLISTIKKDLRQKNIPFAKIEKNQSGQPKIGNLHRLDILNSPLKTHEGPGQGKGRIGDVRQGPTGIPFLQGIQISQKMKQGGGVKRDISTFRVASSKMKGTGRWVHPGLEPTDLMKEAYEWGIKHLDDVILPKIFNQLIG